MKKQYLRNYAELIAKVGLNVQPGQDVMIVANIDRPEFLELVIEECYKCGAARVALKFLFDPLTRLNVKYMTEKELSTLTVYEEAWWKHIAKKKACRLFILSEDPDALEGIDTRKYSDAMAKKNKIIDKYRDMIDNEHQWSIACVPGDAWAKKLFPDIKGKKQREEALWEAILKCSRAYNDDPIAEWKRHNATLREKADRLNSLGIKELHLKNSLGTDLKVGLMDRSRFGAADDAKKDGLRFNPNIPTEECFVSPLKTATEGIVYATKPLVYMGMVINDFWIRFKDGKAVEWEAKEHNDALTALINTDEGSSFLGEIALVPFDSPINESGILFYNTLFDENASCHLALGAGYSDTIEGFENLTYDDCVKMGMNKSCVHEDFMVGSRDLSVTAITKDGKKVEIFRNGTWAK